MKNVWLINHYATSMYENKGGRHYWFAKELIKKGYNVTIICSNQFHEKNEAIDLNGRPFKIEDVEGIRFIFVKTVNANGNGIKRVFNMVSFYRNLTRHYKSFFNQSDKPDYIVGSSVHPLTMVAGIKIAKKLRIPSISEIRDLWPEAIFAFNKAKENSILGRILVRGEKWIYEQSNALIFTKEGDVDYIKEKKWDKESGGKIDLKKCHYINNGVDISFFDHEIVSNKLEDNDLDDASFKVVYAGALRPVNNVGTIVEAAKYLKEYRDIKILIYGQGIEQENLQRDIEQNHLTNVILKGFINKRNIPYILSKSSVNLLNYSQSRYNWSRGNSSNKLFEYMASAKPIICNVKMGYCLIERYNCGKVTADNSGKALADAIKEIYSLDQENYNRLCTQARIAAQDFDFAVLTEKLEHVFEYVSRKED